MNWMDSLASKFQAEAASNVDNLFLWDGDVLERSAATMRRQQAAQSGALLMVGLGAVAFWFYRKRRRVATRRR